MAAPLHDFSGKAVGVIELARDHSEVAAALVRQSWQMVMIALLGTALIAVALVLLLARLSRPLLDSKLPVAGPEEIRRLGSAFNGFVAKIRDTISQLTATLGELAEEVRSLAGRTQHSTAEIRGTIEQLQRAVGTTVTMIEHSVSRAGESVERANQAGEALGRIKGAVNSIRDMNTQIVAASEEQSSVSDEITRNIVSVHEISQATTLVARDTAHIASHVATLVDKLGDLAGQFQDGSNVRMVLSRARAAHMGWKTRVRAYLDGQEGLSRSEAVSDKECRLGHWYFSEGQACCGDQPTFRAMAAPHARLHQVIQQIIELKNQHKHEEAEALYREIEQNSEQVVGCIDQLQREMSKPER